MRSTLKTHKAAVAVSTAVAVAILAFDFSLPLGVAGGVPYVALVLVGLWSPWRRYIYLMAAVGTVLTAVGYYASPAGGTPWVVLTNRGLAVFAIWVTAVAITAFRQSRESLRESEEQFRLVTNAIPALVSYVDADRIYRYANSTYERWFGIPAEEICGRHVRDIHGDERYELLREAIDSVLSGREARFGADLTETKPGPRSIQGHLIPDFDRDGSVKGYFMLTTDVTELKQSEQEVREREEKFKDFADASSDWFWEMDEELRFSYFSDRFQAMTGVEPRFLIGKTREESGVKDSVDADQWRRHVDDLRNHRKFRNFVHSRTKPEGETVWLSISGTPVFNEDDTFKGYRGTGTDITQRKNLEEEIRSTTELLEAMFAASPIGISVVDEKGQVIKWNPAAEDLLGWQCDEVLGKSLPYVVDSDKEGFRQRLQGLQRGETDAEAEIRRHRKDGTPVDISLSTAPLHDAEGRFIGALGLLVDITEQKRSVNELHESHARLVEAQRLAKLGNWDWNVEADNIHGSDEYFRIFGIDPGTGRFTFDDFISLLHPDDKKPIREIVKDLATEETRLPDFEFRIVLPDGSERIVAASGDVFRDGDGNIRSMRGTIQDITERKKALREIQESEARFQAIAHSASTAMIIAKGDDGLIAMWNPAAEKIFGYSEAEALGTPLTRLIPERYREAHIEARKRVYETNELRLAGKVVELKGLRKDGGEFPLELTLGTWSTGATVYFSAMLHDITERRQAESALRESEAKLSSIVQNAPLPILLKDSEGRYIMVNDRGYELFDLPRDGTIGTTIHDHFPKELVKFYEDHERRVLEALTPIEEEFPIPTKDGMRRFRELKFPILDEFGNAKGLGAIISDITDREKAEEQLRQAQKMEAVGQLTGGIAHDFNNLLAVILGNLEFLNERLPDDEDLRELVRIALGATNKGSQLTHQLLAFSRKQPLQPRLVNPREVVEGMGRLLRRTLSAAIDIRLDLNGQWPVIIDQAQLENSLLNIALNSRDAMWDGGTLTIATRDAHLNEDDTKTRDGLSLGAYVIVSVNDTGQGIPHADLEKVFEPFFTTKEVGKGSGLGLSMVYGFVKQSGGYIELSSELDQGTTVNLFLPKADQDAKGAEEGATLEAAPKGKGEVVLVVEDDPDVRDIAVKSLKAVGYHVLAVEDGPSALALAKKRPGLDLLLTDVVLPHGMNGKELAEKLREIQGDLKVLLMSGYGEGPVAGNGGFDEGVELIAKPFRKADLARRVRRALDQTGGPS